MLSSPSRRRTTTRQDSDAHLIVPTLELDTFSSDDAAISDYDIVLKRQRSRDSSPAIKSFASPSRFSTNQLDELWEFAGWGAVQTIELTSSDLKRARDAITEERDRVKPLNHWIASGVDANAVYGSVIYSLPAVVAVAGALSPLSLFIATLLPFLVRPIMEELGSAFPIAGSAYSYLLNSSSKSAALCCAALTLLDYAVNSVNAAGCAAAYVAGETALPFPQYWLAVIILIGFAIVGLLGVKESSSLAFAISAVHCATMLALMIACVVAWSRSGSDVLRANWSDTLAGLSASGVARAVFNGVSLGLLGITGIECAPEYAPICKPGHYPKMLRNLHLGAILLNGPLMLLVLALLPSSTILSGFNILSVLADTAAGRWLRIWVAVDAVIVLCAGVLTGSVSACSLLDRLTLDRVLPRTLLKRLPITHSPWVIQLVFTLLCCAIYASTGASLSIIARCFSISFLLLLALFPISALLLKFNRGRLPRSPRAPLPVVLLALAVLTIVFAGNIALDPSTLGYFSAYALGLIAVFLALKHWVTVLRLLYWVYDQSDFLRRHARTRGWGVRLIRSMKQLRRQSVICFVKTDEINALIRSVLYVQENEPTSKLILVHLFESADAIPRDFEAFSRVLDEAFPSITIDMVFVRGTFDPLHVQAICLKLGVPTSFALISTPGSHFPFTIHDLGGVRIATL